VQECIENIQYHCKPVRLFDQATMFYTLKLHELFNYYDPVLVKHVESNFKDAFPVRETTLRVLPETVTRFYEVDAAVKHDVNQSHRLISTRKTCNEVDSSHKQRPSKRTKRKFTVHELAKVRSTHREETNEDVTDMDKLHAIAEAKISTTHGSETRACDRSQWRKHAIESKVKSGMIHPRGALKLIIADAGMGLLSCARAFYAQHPEKNCSDATMARAVSYLRPYRPPISAGTCSGHEKEVVEVTLLEALKSAGGSTEKATGPANQSEMPVADDGCEYADEFGTVDADAVAC
jgi:hypothetical protein